MIDLDSFGDELIKISSIGGALKGVARKAKGVAQAGIRKGKVLGNEYRTSPAFREGMREFGKNQARAAVGGALTGAATAKARPAVRAAARLGHAAVSGRAGHRWGKKWGQNPEFMKSVGNVVNG